MRRYDFEIVIQETDLDLFGHVNNAAYLRLFENARWDMLSNLGIRVSEIQETGIGPVILEVQVKFLRELKARQKIRIQTEVEPFAGKVNHIKQAMIDEQGQICCQADFVVAVFDLKARKIVVPPPLWQSLAE